MNIDEYTSVEFEKKYYKILELILNSEHFRPIENPKSYLLGGQPGAGKSILNDYIKENNKNNIVIINADEYRKYHPNFIQIEQTYGIDSAKHTSKFSSKITEKLIDELSNKKYNLCIEGTLRTIEVPINTCNLLKLRGYTVELNIMATKENISYLSTQLRYYKFLSKGMTARATAKENHDLVFNLICTNLNKIYEKQIFDDIKIYDRQLNTIYDKSNDKLPGDILSNFYNKAYTEYEIDSLKDIIKQLNSYTNLDYSKYL